MFHRRKPVPPPIDIHDDASIASARLDIRGVSRRYSRTLALDDVSLSLSAGEILAVLGDSGCGKSTLLRLVAGLDAPDSGEIRIDGRPVAGRGGEEPPETRGVGLMFQDYALFPHLTVLANVRFGLRHLPGKQAREVARERLAEVGLAGREASYPATLSGGEAQRVALARALAPRPRLLLLDEPFSNLDAGTRERVRADTLAVLRQDGIGAILVTHDAAEAVEFADRIALMRKGRLVQCGTAEALYRAPVCPFAARALGDVVMVAGLVSGGRLTTPLGSVALPSPRPTAPYKPAYGRRRSASCRAAKACQAGSCAAALPERVPASSSKSRASTRPCASPQDRMRSRMTLSNWASSKGGSWSSPKPNAPDPHILFGITTNHQTCRPS
ncbi:hypothetical protein GCM10025880_33740 [Methylorubrum aminovorans]|nr:hypothetical protein GCM10025880_33740 [Methylorubrum aminovorans]